MLDALYVRQSVERADSVSIESQLTLYRFEMKGNPYREYVDRGFSGKDTHRPGFEALIRDIRRGEIGMVIVRSDTRWQRYFVCSAALQSKRSRCPGINGTVYAKLLEDHLARKMKERLQSLLPNLKGPVCLQGLSLSQKKVVTDALIRRITVGDGTIAVFWSF